MAFEDILGDTPLVQQERPAAGEDGKFSKKVIALDQAVDRGVTASWLAKLLSMPLRQVQIALQTCPSTRIGQNSSTIYDARIALTYLVKPRVNVAEYLANLDPKDLPERMRKEYWSARHVEMKVRAMARDLWHSDDVMEAFANVFKLIKDKTQLWTDTLDESVGLTNEQRTAIEALKDNLMAAISDSIAEYTSASTTESQEAALDVE